MRISDWSSDVCSSDLLEEPIPATIEDNPVTTEPQSLFTDIARNLASEIEELPHQGTSQRVLVTSPLPGDGKSSVALTLAAAAASMGRRAIVVDLDLRRPGPSILRDRKSPRLNSSH